MPGLPGEGRPPRRRLRDRRPAALLDRGASVIQGVGCRLAAEPKGDVSCDSEEAARRHGNSDEGGPS